MEDMEMTTEQLRGYDGSDAAKPIYVAIRGTVYDVSAGRGFYGPGGPYAIFAGREVSRALAKMSKNEEDVNGDLEGLTDKELGVLRYWESKFQAKFPAVGRLSEIAAAPPRRLQCDAGVERIGLPHDMLYQNLLHEPGPLGLHLPRSSSFLEEILLALESESESDSVPALAPGCAEGSSEVSFELWKPEDNKVSSVSDYAACNIKLQASNFPASLLRIGTWKFVSIYEGDLEAKFYFAEHKIVWEILKDGLKSKIEILWSDVAALKATTSLDDDGPDTLEILLSRQPLFFRETNPQPRKHTLWQETTDFTNGQASVCRKHFLVCQQGFLNKHFEKLIQCDPRLNSLSQKPDIISDFSYFETENPSMDNNSSMQGLDNLSEQHAQPLPGLHDSGSPGV